MFLLVLYYGLSLPFVSTHSKSDILVDGSKQNISNSTTLPTLPSTTIPAFNICVLEMEKSEISQIVELFNSDSVNIVDIHISSKTGHDKELLSDFHVELLNPIGREILYILINGTNSNYFPWTLKAGVRNFRLHFKENQNDCIKKEKNATNFALENTQNIIRSLNLAEHHDVCSSFKETSSGKVIRTCCQITKSNFMEFNYECSMRNSILYRIEWPWSVIRLVMYLFALFYFTWLLSVLWSRAIFDLKCTKYSKMEECPMSPSFIFFKIIWGENDPVVSFIRRCIFTCALYSPIHLETLPVIISWPLFLILVLPFLISSYWNSKITDSSNLLKEIKKLRDSSLKRVSSTLTTISSLFKRPDNELCQAFVSPEFASLTKLLTLPFNLEYWRERIDWLCEKWTTFTTRVREQFENRILKILVLFAGFILVVIFFLLYVCTVFLCNVVLIILCACCHFIKVLVLVELFITYNSGPWPLSFFAFMTIMCLNFCLSSALLVMVIVIKYFLLGLFLNLVYFIPYFASFSVLTFYCFSYWKSTEEKYLILKRLIYETCRDIQHNNNGCMPNRRLKQKEIVLPVVSKELYDKIRKKLLPYHTNLFYLGLKLFWSFGFAGAIFILINVLNELNVTGVVQVVTAGSLGVMPHVLNMVALKTSEERKKAWSEKLKLNVKFMVEELVCEDPELGRTVLMIQEDNELDQASSDSDGGEPNENIQYVTSV